MYIFKKFSDFQGCQLHTTELYDDNQKTFITFRKPSRCVICSKATSTPIYFFYWKRQNGQFQRCTPILVEYKIFFIFFMWNRFLTLQIQYFLNLTSLMFCLPKKSIDIIKTMESCTKKYHHASYVYLVSYLNKWDIFFIKIIVW